MSALARRREESLKRLFSDIISDAPTSFSRPRVLAPMANKGGVGKTLTSRIIGEAIALHISPKLSVPNNRVLICDLDPQCNMSSRYLQMACSEMMPGDLRSPYVPPAHPDLVKKLPDGQNFSAITDILFADHDPKPYPTGIEHLDVVPAWGAGITELETFKNGSPDYRLAVSRMREWVASPEVAEKYCLVILDTAPRLNILSSMALRASTHVYIPYRPEPQGLQGLSVMLHAISDEALDVRPEGDPLKLLGIFPNAVDTRTTLHGSFLKYILENEELKHYVTSCRFSDLKAHYAESDYVGRDPADLLQSDPSSKPFAEVADAVREFAWVLGFLEHRRI